MGSDREGTEARFDRQTVLKLAAAVGGAGLVAGRTGEVAVGIRPEKIDLGGGQENTLDGTIADYQAGRRL